MTKRNLPFVIAFITAAVLLAVLMSTPRNEPPRFTEEQFESLNDGMTREEVVTILGPSGDYTGRQGSYRRLAGGHVLDGMGVPADTKNCWCGHHGLIQIDFDENERLAGKMYWHAWPLPLPRGPTLWQRLEHWIGVG